MEENKSKKKLDLNFRAWGKNKEKNARIEIANSKRDEKNINYLFAQLYGTSSQKEAYISHNAKVKRNKGFKLTEEEVSKNALSIINQIKDKLAYLKNEKKIKDREAYEFLRKTIETFDENKYENDHYLNKNRLPEIVYKEVYFDEKQKDKINYGFINDKLRLNLTKAYSSYIPEYHLRNMKNEKDKSREVKREYDNFKKKIYEGVDKFTKKGFYKEKYEKIKEKYKQEALKETMVQKDDKMNKTSTTAFYSRPGTSIKLYRGKSVQPNKRTRSEQEKMEKDLNLLSDALKSLKDTLKKTSAEKYIDNVDRPRDLTNEEAKNQYFEEQKAKYFPEINRAFESVKQVIANEGDEFTSNLTIEDAKKQADFENKLLLNQMEMQKEKLLKNLE